MITTVRAERISFKTLFKIVSLGNLIFTSVLLILLEHDAPYNKKDPE